MPTYEYQHPKTGEIFEDIRRFDESDEPYIAEDGTECPRIMSRRFGIVDKNQEVFEMDEAYTRYCEPKFVKFRDGHKERYNPSKHIGGSGKSADIVKINETPKPSFKGSANQKIFKDGIWWEWNDDDKEWKKEV